MEVVGLQVYRTPEATTWANLYTFTEKSGVIFARPWIRVAGQQSMSVPHFHIQEHNSLSSFEVESVMVDKGRLRCDSWNGMMRLFADMV